MFLACYQFILADWDIHRSQMLHQILCHLMVHSLGGKSLAAYAILAVTVRHSELSCRVTPSKSLIGMLLLSKWYTLGGLDSTVRSTPMANNL